MKTKILLTVLIVLLVSLLSGCGDPEPTPAPTPTPIPPTPTSPPESTRQEFSSEEGWFSVSMPYTPTEEQQNQPSDVGDITLHTFMVEDENSAYAVMYFDFPVIELLATEQDIEQVLDDGRDGALTNVNATLVSEERISLDGHTGRHIVYEISDDTIPGGGEGVLRFFLVDGRVFQLLAIGAKGQLPASDVAQFLDSFQVLEHPSPAAPAQTSTPESVLQTLFDAANSGDFSALQNLCDPLGENDGDTQMICDLATDDTHRQEFVQYFAQGKLNGQAVINGNQAEVPFLYGPDGTDAETMDLIQRDGQWYLYSF